MMSFENSFQLTAASGSEIRPANIPSKGLIHKAAVDLLSSTANWKEGKAYTKGVKTFTRPKGPGDGSGWSCRVSEHSPSEVTFDNLWRALSVNKAETEKEFIPAIQRVVKIKETGPNQSIWSMLYTFAPPLLKRVYTVLQDVSLSEEDGLRSGIVVSIPVDLSQDPQLAQLEEKGTKARYIAVERVRELPNGNTEWSMATSAVAGGVIPVSIVEMTLSKEISKDVPNLLKWLKKQGA